MKISIVIPVFNENDSLPDLKKELVDNLKNCGKWEVIFVDDGSSDGSSEWLSELVSYDDNFKALLERSYDSSIWREMYPQIKKVPFVVTYQAIKPQ